MKIPKEAATDVKQSIDSTSTTEVNSKKKRNSNFNKAEVQCLIKEYSVRAKAIKFGTREQKQKSWEVITAIINNTHSGATRSVMEIKKKWVDLLYSAKKEYAKATKEAEKAGNKKRCRLSDAAEMIVKLRGGLAVKKYNKAKIEKEAHIVQADTSLEDVKSNGQTIFYIPHVDEYLSSNEDSQEATNSAETMGDANFNACDGGINTAEGYETYGQILNITTPAACTCGLSSEHLRLKQETVAIMKRKIEIDEEQRNDEKQKLWEEKVIRRLRIQKLELEIKLLKSNIATES